MERISKVYFTTIAARLDKGTNANVGMRGLRTLICGWNNKRERHGFGRINFARRVADENEWRKLHGFPPEYEQFMYSDELELFSRYAGYDLTH